MRARTTTERTLRGATLPTTISTRSQGVRAALAVALAAVRAVLLVRLLSCGLVWLLVVVRLTAIMGFMHYAICVQKVATASNV